HPVPMGHAGGHADHRNALQQPLGEVLMSSWVPNVRSRGFSLVEVMVAVIVICVGLLGIAKLQALSLSNTTTSRLRALAAIQVASVAAAMHSNRSEEHTSELQSLAYLVCRLLLE